MEVSKKEKKCIRYLTQEMSKEDRAVFEIELTLDNELKTLFENYKLVWNHYPLDSLPEKELEKDLTGKDFTFSIDSKFPVKKRRSNLKKYATVFSCASILILVSVYFFSFNQLKYTNHFTTQKGERQTIYLPDSTLVFLNALSEIRYPNEFEDSREVFVKGEVFFDVTHDKDKPFIVHTKELDVQVLGTAFNVNTLTSDKVISLERGKVNVVIKKSNNQLSLRPNEQLIFNNRTNDIIKKNFSVTETLAWKSDMLILDNILFKDAIEQINHFYGVSFRLVDHKLENKRITGAFKGQNIDEFISTLEFIANISVDPIRNNEYLIIENNGN